MVKAEAKKSFFRYASVRKAKATCIQIGLLSYAVEVGARSLRDVLGEFFEPVLSLLP
jgi:hypothetical protein